MEFNEVRQVKKTEKAIHPEMIKLFESDILVNQGADDESNDDFGIFDQKSQEDDKPTSKAKASAIKDNASNQESDRDDIY